MSEVHLDRRSLRLSAIIGVAVIVVGVLVAFWVVVVGMILVALGILIAGAAYGMRLRTEHRGAS